MFETSLEAALTWRSLGIATIPILASSKRPALISWTRWQTELPSEKKLRAWFCVDYSIAVICGGLRNLIVVDFDSLERHKIWLANQGQDVDTYHVRTRNGWHYYFYVDELTRCSTILWNYCQECQEWTLHRMVPVKMLECLECGAQGKSGQEQRIDIKASGGQAMTPPSIHPSGHHYRGYGSPSQIAKIASVKDVLPEYEDAPQWTPREREPLDPFDEAMRDPIGLSIETIKANWQWSDIIPVNGRARRGVVMVECPFHSDKHASLAIYSDGHAHCFGCGWHGRDVIDGYAALHKITLREAMREMA